MRSIPRLIYLHVLFFFISKITYATDYYVDKNANGSNNGISWTNAWESFADINWGVVEPGDFIYISGGTDSTVYYETLEILDVQGTAAQHITIIAGKYAPDPTGHSGKVIIDGEDTRVRNIYLGSDSGVPYSTDYITIKGIKCVYGLNSAIELEGRTNVTVIDSCELMYFGDLAGVFARGMGQTATCDGIDSLMIRRCRIITYDYYNGQTDGIYLDACTNTFIYDNYIHITNQDEYAHVDCIQRQWSVGKLVIVNNVLINDSVYSPEGGGMPIIIRSSDLGEHDPIIIYNNYCYMGGPWMAGANEGIVFNTHAGDQPTHEPAPIYILHNTIVGNGPKLTAASLEYFGQGNDGKGVFHNNIVSRFYSDAPNYGKAFWGTGGGVDPVHIDSCKNNLYYSEGEVVVFSGNWTNGSTTNSGFNWTYWTGTLGGSGQQADPLFVNNIGYEPDQSVLRGYLQSNSPAINAGYDAEWYINYLNDNYNLEGIWALEWADIDGNPRDATPTIGAYEYDSGPDLTPPEVTSAALLDSVTLVVNFSEALDETTAEDENNYSITNNINIFSASLSGRKVTLQTSSHLPGINYTVIVINVEDLAGNPIGQSNTAEYLLLPPDTLVMLPIEDVLGVIQEPGHTPLKTIDGLGALSGDPDSRWAAEPMPEELVFDLGSIRTVGKTKLSFYNWNAGRIYNYSISISSDNNNWITIVPQATSAYNEEWTIDEFFLINARYVQVHFINNNQSNWAGLWEGEIWGTNATVVDPSNNSLPNGFSLSQNYPNPFNPSTTISYFIPISSFVTLKVYDVLGNAVATLVNEEKSEGSYEVMFSTIGGSTSGGDVYNLPSGIYFYRLQAGSFVETKKMILLK